MKYIIESNDVIGYTPKYAMLFGDGYMIQRLEDLEELNSDYINGHYGSLQDEAYQRGLENGRNETWEAARKVALSPDDGGLSPHDLFEIFGDDSLQYAFKNYSASEAIVKLKACEEKQKADEDVKRGDVVIRIDDGAKYLVTYVGDGRVCGINEDGAWHGANLKNVARTGEHHDIDKIMGKLRK